MNRNASWTLARPLILAVVLLIGLGLASASAPAAESLVLERLSTATQSLELALFLTKAAILSPSTDDMAVNLQEVICLLAGREGAPPDSCTETGILEHLESVLEELPATSFDLSVQSALRSAIEYAASFLTLAITRAQQSIDEIQSSGGPSADVKTIYSYLSAAMGAEDDTYTLGGLRHALSILPNQTIWVQIGDSILDAIDAVLPGGTIYVEPGTHQLDEGIVISKSVTLARSPGSVGAIELVIPSKPYASLLAVSLPDDSLGSAVTVRLSDVHLAEGYSGITVSNRGSADLVVILSRVTIADCSNVGIKVQGGHVQLEDCTLEGNGVFGLSVADTATVELRGCRIAGNGMPDFAGVEFRLTAGVWATAASNLTLADCTVEGNRGPGVFVEEGTKLMVLSCRILDNQEDGLRLWDDSALQMTDCEILRNDGMGVRFHVPECDSANPSFTAHHFSGVVEGSGNLVPGPGEEDGNTLGGVCPGEYSFLLIPSDSMP